MNALSINIAAQSLFSRFLWKEYRMLRGFWLAVFVIAFVIQWFFSTDILYTGSFSNVVFFISWSAAALYSVGAAITLFAAETEERTREYLRLLPGDWKPMFAAKIALATLSILLLGLALSLTGAWLEGWTTSQDARLTLGVAGVAAVEGLCWGLLFSLWWRQPLFAAIAAMACGSLGAQLAISFGSNSQESWTAQAYANAAPARLLICLGLFAGAVLLGRRWFYPQLTDSNALAERNGSTVRALPLTQIKSLPRTKMLSRLLWQTWRESWKSMLAGLVLGSVLTVVLAGFADFISELHNYSLACVGLITPALLGSLVFRPDQQRDHRLFIATHAIPPRRMWLARQIVWLALVVVSVVIINTFTSWFFNLNIQNSLSLYLRGEWGYTELLGREFENSDSPWTQWWRFEHARELFSRAVLTAWCAVIAAYGVGQLCSMLLRQSLLAGFLAILLSIVIGAWSLLMFFWQMPSLVFVLPVGLAALLATWLRTPSWVIGRNTVRSWLAPTAVIVATVVLMIVSVPSTRLGQVNRPTPDYPFLIEPLNVSLEKFMDQKNDQISLLHQLGELAKELDVPKANEILVDGKTWEELGITQEDIDRYSLGESLDQDVFTLIERNQIEYRRQLISRNEHLIPKFLKLLKQPNSDSLLSYPRGDNEFASGHSQFYRLLEEKTSQHIKEGELDKAWEQLRIGSSYGLIFDWEGASNFRTWAEHPLQTAENLRTAINDLIDRYKELPSPREELIFEHQRIRRILVDDMASQVVNDLHPQILDYLPGERARALAALDRLTTQSLNYLDTVVALGSGGNSYTNGGYEEVDNPRELIRMAHASRLFAVHQIAFMGNKNDHWRAIRLAEACTTSHQTSKLYESIVEFDRIVRYSLMLETERRATLVYLALLAYRIDHEQYPQSLAELTPEYLPEKVEDPYSNGSFKYSREGVAYPLDVYWHTGSISSHTPFLWSVGEGNSKLHLGVNDDPNATSQVGDDNIPRKGQIVYRLRPTETNGYAKGSLVFPLPK